jgi:hypothetical protein
MSSDNLPPLSVEDYSRDYLIELVRYKTGWGQRSEVAEKPQLNYLHKYLASETIDCKTIVVENEYVDRHYLEDYSEYYARCFPTHPRKCTRLHFFNLKFEEPEFTKCLAENDEVFQAALAEKYIGFVVIRPIPHTFFAKICLSIYTSLLKREKKPLKDEIKILTRDIPVSLFGIPLIVKTIPFLEQDRVVSACATSALWSALNAMPEIPHTSLPSPSAITKSAIGSYYEGTRTFPTSGLTPLQVARSFKYYGLEPTIFQGRMKVDFSYFKECIFSYVSDDIPVLIGGEVFEKMPNGKIQRLGKHLVCVVGYSTAACELGSGLKLHSHEINKIYVHDDRYGPFVKVRTSPESFEFDEQRISGLPLAIHNIREDYIVPEVAIIGLNHKIRIPYSQILDTCKALHAYVKVSLKKAEALSLQGDFSKDPAAQDYVNKIVLAMNGFDSAIWDIALTTATALKNDVLKTKYFSTFNGLIEKNLFLTQSLPKYLWRCRGFARSVDGVANITDIIFDATEIPQGRMLIGYISYTNDAQLVWNYIEELINGRVWQGYPMEAASKQHKQSIRCIVKFFDELKGSTELNTLFGPPRLPSRSLKKSEADDYQNIKLRRDIRIIKRNDKDVDWVDLKIGVKYIWAIDEFGNLFFGEETLDEASNGFLGHPTLLNGNPGRLGGELYFDDHQKFWIINTKSKAYSGHFEVGSVEAKGYLTNAVLNFFQGFDVRISA